MQYKVLIRDTHTGEERWYDPELDWDEGSWFWWVECNFSCDCNRYLSFERAAGNEPDLDDAVCGEGRYRVPYAILADGTREDLDDDPCADVRSNT